MSVTEIEHESWFSRLISSIGGVLIGLLLFILAFPLLFWGEGRAVKRAQDLEAGATAVVSVSAETVDPSQDGALVHLSGEAVTDETLRDAVIGQAVTALRLRRSVEMYQWVEHSESTTRKKLGGGTKKVTTYTYSTQWSGTPENSANFKEGGHDNPPMPARDETIDATGVTLGARVLSAELVGQIDAFEPLTPVPGEAVVLDGREARIEGGAYYFGGDLASPTVGDVRVTLSHVASPTLVSIIAAQRGDSFSTWATPDGRELEARLELGTRSSAQMFEQLEADNETLTWLIRLGGFAMMLFGLLMILRPLVVVADVVPLIGSLIQGGAFLVSFALALPLTLGTIAVGWIAYRPLLGITLIVAAVAIFAGGIALKRKTSGR